MRRHEEKEECRTDSHLSRFVQLMKALGQGFKFCIEFGSPTRGDPYARTESVSTLGWPNVRVKPMYPILQV